MKTNRILCILFETILYSGILTAQTPALFKAVADNDTFAITMAIRNGAEINGLDGTGATALQRAASNCYPESILCLLDKGADADAAFRELGPCFYQLGFYEQSIPFLTRISEEKKVLTGEGQGDYARALMDLAEAYKLTGNLDKALELDLQARQIIETVFGKQHYQYGVVLHNLSNIYELLEQIDTAFALLKEATTNALENFGPEHEAYAVRLGGQAGLYVKIGKYEKARDLYLESLGIYEKTKGKDSYEYGVVLSNLANAYINLARYDSALVFAREALENARTTVGVSHPDYASCLSAIGSILAKMGKYREAEAPYREAVSIAGKVLGQKHLWYGIFANNLAHLFQTAGQYDSASYWYRIVLKNMEDAVGKDNEQYAIAVNNIGFLYWEMGVYSKALEMLELARSITARKLGVNHNFYALRLANLAEIYHTIGQFDRALPLFLQAKEIMAKTIGEEHVDYAPILGNIANIYQNTGQYDKAEALFLQSAAIIEHSLGKNHDKYGHALNNLGTLYFEMGKNEKALATLQEALSNTEKSLGKNHKEYGANLNNLVHVYLSVGDTVNALQKAREALVNTEKSLGKKHEWYGIRLMNLAEVYSKMGKTDTALILLEEALQTVRNAVGEDHQACVEILHKTALLQSRTGRFQDAANTFKQLDTMLLRHVKYNFAVLSEFGKEKFLSRNLTEKYNDIFAFTLCHKEQFPELVPIVFNEVMLLKGLLLRSHARELAEIKHSGNQATDTLYASWIEHREALAKLLSLPREKRYRNADSLGNAADELETRLVAFSQAFRKNTEQIGWEKVRNSLKTGEAVVEFINFLLPGTDSVLYCALVLKSGSSQRPQMLPLFEERTLDGIFAFPGDTIHAFPANVKPYVEGVYDGIVPPGLKDKYQTLYQIVFQPLGSLLSDVKRIYLSPSGQLHRIAFAATEDDKGKLLGNRFDLYNIGSARDLIFLRPHERILIETARVFGGIRYSAESEAKPYICLNRGSSDRGYPCFLPGTWREMRALYHLFKANNISCDTISGLEADEDSVKTHPGNDHSSNILHIGTHGYFKTPEKKNFKNYDNQFNWADNPMFRSYLLMARGLNAHLGNPPIDNQSDGILSAYEIATIDLADTRLVTLSACVSALGDVHNAEGVYGLQRAFKMAGAQYLLVTLWPVDDAATQLFMEKFYNYWITDNLDIREAFRETQKAFREDDGKYSHPYYWAAFVLI